MKTSIVIGSQLGDEGKGSTTNYLVKESYRNGVKPLVVRFSGGPQAGHNVVVDGISHTFHHFGSGAFQEARTFWSKYCYTEPGDICNEYYTLVDLGLKPVLYIDPMSPVITPYDRAGNQQSTTHRLFGTCGQGIGYAAKRTEESPAKLYATDLFAPRWVLEERMKMIRNSYGTAIRAGGDIEMEAFYTYAEALRDIVTLCREEELHGKSTHLIFEGSQGILLDRDHGFFPHVTRAHTTSKNAKEMIERNGWDTPEVYYVTRPYLTRHGNGPMGPIVPVELKNTEGEINVTNPWQGEFRTSIFNRQLFDYALSCDPYSYLDYTVVVTGMDRVTGPMTYRNRLGDVVTTDKYLFGPSLCHNCIISEHYKFMQV